MFAIETTWQADVIHEHVARVGALPLARVGAAATPAAEVARLVVAFAWVVIPGIEHRAPLSETPAF
jgi:hypothetical protein